MLFAILTLFPEALDAYLGAGMLRVAQEKGLVRIRCVDFRDFARDRHRTVDDRPFGGGPGMVLKPEPIVECVEWLESRHGRFRKLLLCPTGERFCQARAVELANEERVLLVCGRYEGFDERIRTHLELEEISLGDFVLSGGELPALAIAEAVVRLVPGVLGDERSAAEDSFGADGGLDHPHYTRPRVWRGEAVPEVLLGGDHAAIRRWREEQAQVRTRARRPELARPALPGVPGGGEPPSQRTARDASGTTERITARRDPRVEPTTNQGGGDLPREAAARTTQRPGRPGDEPCT